MSIRQSTNLLGGVCIVALGMTSLLWTSAAGSAASSQDLSDNAPQLLSTHPWAAAQPTEIGRQLVELRVHDGKVWAGYGDYSANTGPVTLAPLDPSNGTYGASFDLDSEAVYNIRQIRGQLVAPATDPRANADFGIGAPWSESRPLRATHVYDSVSLTDDDLWMVGSSGRDAVAWRSMDRGQTWTEALRQPPENANDAARFYFAGRLNDSLVLQAADARGGPQRTALEFDGLGWAELPSILERDDRGWRAEEFGAGIVFHTVGHGRAGSVRYFDGQVTVTLMLDAYDVEVTDEAVYILATDGSVVRSTDLATWDRVGAGPQTSRSLAVSGDQVYFGTTDSEIWSARVQVESSSTATTGESVAGHPTLDRSKSDRCPKGWQKKGRC